MRAVKKEAGEPWFVKYLTVILKFLLQIIWKNFPLSYVFQSENYYPLWGMKGIIKHWIKSRALPIVQFLQGSWGKQQLHLLAENACTSRGTSNHLQLLAIA